MSDISNNEIKRVAVRWIPTTTNETGKLYKSGDNYKVWDGREFLTMGDTGLVKMYESTALFPTTGFAGIFYRVRPSGYIYYWASERSEYVKFGEDTSAMIWQGTWVDGAYNKNDVVIDGYNTYIATAGTIDRPAPQELGFEEYSIAPATTMTGSTDISVVAQIHDFNILQNGFIKAIQLYVPTYVDTLTSRVTIENQTNGDIEIIHNPVLVNATWVDIAIGQYFAKIGDNIRVTFTSYNITKADAFNVFSYAGYVTNTPPADTSFYLDSTTAPTSLQLDYNDALTITTSHKAALDAVVVGTIIDVTETGNDRYSMKLEVSSVTAGTDYITYGVTLLETGVSGGPREGKLTNVFVQENVTVATPYGKNGTYYLTQPDFANVYTELHFDGVDQGNPATDAYGINMIFQEATISDDWEIVSSIER